MKKCDLLCVIEDDPTHLFITRKMIEMSGIVKDIIVYKNGKEAFDNLKAIFQSAKKLPEIILVDINMPIWDGWYFIEEFTKLPFASKLCIYILTSSNSTEDQKNALKYNLHDKLIIKPISVADIQSLVHNCQ